MNKLRKAIVDLGSRAARLLVADVERDSIKVHISRGFLTLLGQSIDGTSLKRLNYALRNFKDILDKNSIRVDEVSAIGTEVFRQYPGLASKVRRYFPNFRIITGEEEARFSFAAGVFSQKILEENQRVLVVDQGGGSLELSFGYRLEDMIVVEEAISFGGFGTFNFPDDRRKFLEELILKGVSLEDLDQRWPKGIQTVIGMGSVVTQLAFLQSAKSEYRIEEVNGFVIAKEDLRKRARKELSLSAFLDILEYYSMDTILVSGWGTRHGALFSERIIVKNPQNRG